MKLNKHMQKLLGLNESEYTLFKRDPNSSGIPQTIIGDKEIQIEQKYLIALNLNSWILNHMTQINQ